MKLSLKHIALAASLVVAASGANAAIANSSANGNSFSGDMFVSLVSASNSASFAADLGLRLDQFIGAVAPSATGIKLVWDLKNSTFTDLSTVATGLASQVQSINYGSLFTTFGQAGAADLKFDVKAMDGLPNALAGAGTNRYLSTSGAASVTATNGQIFVLDSALDPYVNASNADTTNSTHGTAAAGANVYDAGDNSNVYFVNASGDSWKNNTSFASTGAANSPLNLFFLANSSSTAAAQGTVTKYAGEFTLNTADGTLSYISPVPEADSIAMVLAGLGLMGTILRRRKSA